MSAAASAQASARAAAEQLAAQKELVVGCSKGIGERDLLRSMYV